MEENRLFAYIGTYTTENSKGNRNAHGVGIYVYEIDRRNGTWTLLQEVPTLNPAVLAYGRDKRLTPPHLAKKFTLGLNCLWKCLR